MESENFEQISNIFNEINIEDNTGSENNDIYVHEPSYVDKRQPIPPRIFPKPIDFEKYVQENYHNKFKILDRTTFHQIKSPIIIFFNHFREKCAYHTKWLDRIYQLALKYGDQIEFIAADMIDLDVIHPKRDPLSFFCRMVRPENENPTTYAIDENKRIHQHFDAYKTIESLSELCEDLLKGNLYPSQPIPENNDTNLVKICVHHNYEDLILKSSKNIFLIVNYENFSVNNEYEPNYENVALQLKDYNLDIVYMEGKKNYVPFEYYAYSILFIPTILFIPHNDKNNFVYYWDSRTDESVIAFLKEIIEKPEILQRKQEEQSNQLQSKQTPLILSNDFELNFNDLPQFLRDNFNECISVLNRKELERLKNCILIVYMNFQGKCLAHHVRWLEMIYRVAKRCYGIQILIADFKDIDLINSKWKPTDFVNNTTNREDELPKLFGFDRLKHTYDLGYLQTAASFFYITDCLANNNLYYTQCYREDNSKQLVKTWIADCINQEIKDSKKHIFITFYQSDHHETEKLLKAIEDIANDVKELNVEVVQYDAKENYVDLEYAHQTYPVHYFIPCHDKKQNFLYINNNLNKHEMLKFIEMNVQKH